MILAPRSRSAATARCFADRELCSWGLEELSAAVQLVVTELVANAVLHAGTVAELVLMRRGRCVRVEVTDWGDGAPRLRDAPVEAPGRGVPIIDALSARWGVIEHGVGKTVWAEIEASPASARVARVSRDRPGLLEERVEALDEQS